MTFHPSDFPPLASTLGGVLPYGMSRLAQAVEGKDATAFARAVRAWAYCGVVAVAPTRSEDWHFLPTEGEPNPTPEVFHVEQPHGGTWSLQAALSLPLPCPWPGVLVTADLDGTRILEALASGTLCVYHLSPEALLAPWEDQPLAGVHEDLRAHVAQGRLKPIVDLPLDLCSDRLPRSPHAHL